MNDSTRAARLIFLGLISGLLLVMAGAAIGWLVSGGLTRNEPLPASESLVVRPTRFPTVVSDPSLILLTPKPTFTPLPTTPTPQAEPTATTTLTATVPMDVVLFRVQVETLDLYQSAGDANPLVGTVARDTVLPVIGRTADGLWWMVCCVDDQSGWLRLDGANVLVEGDVGSVDVLDVPINNQQSAAPAPEAAAAPPVAEAQAAAPASAPSLASEPLPATATPPPPAIPTPQPPPPEPRAAPEAPRNLDARLTALGVGIEPADVAPGAPYWRVAEVLWHDEAQAEGRHSLFIEVVDEQGNRVVGQPLTVWWGDGSQQLVIENKPFPEYGANFPMYAAGQAYSVQVDGLPSEKIHGLGLGDLIKRDWTIHVEYLIRFQRATR